MAGDAGNANTLTVTTSLSLNSIFAGNRVIYAAARDNADMTNSGWQPIDVWSVLP